MSEISKRHHYIPQFYIKKFCNEEGSIFINDKDNSRNYDNVKKYYPNGIFFEWNRNTYEINGKNSDIIEKLYCYLEDKISPFLDLLTNPKDGYLENISVETLRNLIYLGYLIKWRIPKYDKLSNTINQNNTFDDFSLFGKIDDNFFSLDGLTSEDISRELKRLLLSASLFNDETQYNNVFKNCFIIPFPYPLLTSDNPFVEFPSQNDNETPSFIFPLTSNLLLVSCSFIDKYKMIEAFKNEEKYKAFINYLYNCVQITLMWNAEKYVGCEDRDYFKTFVENVEDYSNKLESYNLFPPLIAFNALKNYETFFE